MESRQKGSFLPYFISLLTASFPPFLFFFLPSFRHSLFLFSLSSIVPFFCRSFLYFLLSARFCLYSWSNHGGVEFFNVLKCQFFVIRCGCRTYQAFAGCTIFDTFLCRIVFSEILEVKVKKQHYINF